MANGTTDPNKNDTTATPAPIQQAGGGVTFQDPTPDVSGQEFVQPTDPSQAVNVGSPAKGEETPRNLSPEFATVFQNPNEGRNRDLEQENLRKLRASGELGKTAPSAAVQAKINMATYGVENPVFGAVDSSATADRIVEDQIKEIGGGFADIADQRNLPQYKLYQDFTEDLKESRQVHFDLFERTKANIEKDFEIRESEQRDENRITTGFQSKSLARMGAFGASGSALNYMQGVDRKNQEKINKLLVQKEQLLIAATQAQANQDFEMLNAIIAENTRVTDQFNQVQQWQFEDSMKNEDQIMEQTRFGWEEEGRAMEKISNIYTSFENFDDIPFAEQATLSAQAGMSIETMEAVFDRNKKAANIAEDKELWGILSEIEEGRTVKLNGRYYTGLKSKTETASNNKMYMVTDKNDNQYLVTVDPDGNQVNKINLTNKFQDQPSQYTPAQEEEVSSNLKNKFTDGAVGGQCGTFVRTQIFTDYPSGLNTLEQKEGQISPNIGFGENQFPPRVGDAVIQDVPAYYSESGSTCSRQGDQWVDGKGNLCTNAGHIAVINSIDQENGIVTLTESNYGLDERVTTTRTLNIQDPSISGYFRGTLREDMRPLTIEGEEGDTDLDMFKNENKDAIVDLQKDVDKTLEDIKRGDDDGFEVEHDILYTRYKNILDQIATLSDPSLGYNGDGRVLLDAMLQKDRL